MYAGPERAVREVMATLQARLADEIARVEAERGDWIALPRPSRWYERPVSLATAAEACPCAVEVFEASVEALSPEVVLAYSGDFPAVRQRVEVVVRVSHRGEAGASSSAMAARSRRLAAAVVRVVRDNPRLASGYDSMALSWSSLASLEYGEENDKHVTADRATVRLFAEYAEATDGEGQSGAGALAALPYPLS